jgi:hypothetical protein
MERVIAWATSQRDPTEHVNTKRNRADFWNCMSVNLSGRCMHGGQSEVNEPRLCNLTLS